MPTVLRPMNAGELLDRTFFLYRKHFIVFAGIMVLPQLILLAVNLSQILIRAYNFGIAAILIWYMVLIIASIVTSMMAYAATTIAVSDLHLGRAASIRTAYAGVKGCYFRLFVTTILIFFGTCFGLILFIVPGIILALSWSLSVPVIVIEKEKALNAMKRSQWLTKGNRLRIFVTLILVAILLYLVMIIFQIPFIALTIIFAFKSPGGALTDIPSWLQALNAVGSFFSGIIAVPASTIAVSLIYYDARVRKEGFDLQLLMQSIESATPVQTEGSVVS
jgi:hypothetical protein